MIFLEYFSYISLLSVNKSLNCHISGRFGSISRHLIGASFFFSNHGGITPKFKLLGGRNKTLEPRGGGISKQFPPKYLLLMVFEAGNMYKGFQKMSRKL